MKTDVGIFELLKLSEEIEEIRKRVEILENRIELIEANYVTITDLEVVQKQVEKIASELWQAQAQKVAAELNALADALCHLMQQIGELVDKVINMWREVSVGCRC
jgi:tetrahydromethanopterin S-methyltransferase subunit G